MELDPEVLYRNSHRLINQISLDFKREISDRINWKPRVIGIKGPKGVGKSTLILQHIRETFFYNQLSRFHKMNNPEKGDFLVDEKYLFEVGGPKKTFSQMKDLPDSYLAVDGVEFGRGNRIPLWLFGFVY